MVTEQHLHMALETYWSENEELQASALNTIADYILEKNADIDMEELITKTSNLIVSHLLDRMVKDDILHIDFEDDDDYFSLTEKGKEILENMDN